MVTVGYMFSKATPLSNITWTKEFRDVFCAAVHLHALCSLLECSL